MSDTRAPDLGRRYRDRVSDFEGIATAYYTYLNGCVRVELTGKAVADKEIPSFIFDIDQVDLLDDPVPVRVTRSSTLARTSTSARATGGPTDRRPVPRP